MTPITVLLVEDSAAIRALVRRMLVAGGHRVIDVAAGAAALAACREQQPDVMLLDVEMPEMSGIDLARSIKNHPRLSRIPIVLMSSAGVEVQALASGSEAFITKPFSSHALSSLLSLVMEGEGPLTAQL